MTTRPPVLFISHGSPMLAVEQNPAADAWAALAAGLPRPKAVLMISAHWESRMPLLGGASSPETIHDFGGFPAELYRLRYPAPGAPDMVRKAQNLLREAGYESGIEGCRGLDHGAWIPMMKMYPQADVPVFQLSIQPELGAAHHLALGAALAPLRDEGVMIIGSGHMTHNLRDYFYSRSGERPAYAREFRDWVATRLNSGDTTALLDWEHSAPHAQRAHPTPEHFLPIFAALGAAGDKAIAECIYAGFDHEVLAMDAWRWN